MVPFYFTGYESNFDIASGIYDVDTRYDYGSIMHYSATSFTANGSPTISVPNGETIGQRTALSDCDVERIQVHYGCKDKVCYPREDARLPANTTHLYNICTMLDQRQRPWADVVKMLYKCLVFSGIGSIVLLI